MTTQNNTMKGSMRVTNLEKFVKEQVWNPYKNIAPFPECPEMWVLASHLQVSNEVTNWANLVLNRLQGIGITFPSWINHPIVDVLVSRGVAKKESNV